MLLLKKYILYIYVYVYIAVDANDNTRISRVKAICSGSSLPWHRVRNFFTACMLQNTNTTAFSVILSRLNLHTTAFSVILP